MKFRFIGGSKHGQLLEVPHIMSDLVSPIVRPVIFEAETSYTEAETQTEHYELVKFGFALSHRIVRLYVIAGLEPAEVERAVAALIDGGES